MAEKEAMTRSKVIVHRGATIATGEFSNVRVDYTVEAEVPSGMTVSDLIIGLETMFDDRISKQRENVQQYNDGAKSEEKLPWKKYTRGPGEWVTVETEGPHASKRYDVVLTNPPFGTKGAGEAPTREDFTVETSNKQLNFLQHVITILKPGGRAAIVLPDNVLFDEAAGKEVRKLLMTDCSLHTILRLPVGTFTPYSTGVKANILFFTKGEATEEVWIYDNRNGIEKVTIGHTLTPDYFNDFETCYHMKPRQVTERFRRFTREEITKQYNDSLDIVWLKDEATQGEQKLDEPDELAQEAAAQLQTALDALSEITLTLDSAKKMRSNA